jgi:hypothetical protein
VHGVLGNFPKYFSGLIEPEGLNFQKRAGGKIKPYQARQLKKMVERYLGGEATGEDVVAGANEVTGTNDDETP